MNSSKSVKATYIMLRHVGIAIEVLPKSFPLLSEMQLITVDDEKVDYAGYGGCKKIDGDTGIMTKPFIAVNVAMHQNMCDILGTLAHEMLHVKQTHCLGVGANHGNKFRKDCSLFAQALGLTYWHVNGYDKPSLKTFMSIQAKKLKAFKKS
jgi:hypothetical protein